MKKCPVWLLDIKSIIKCPHFFKPQIPIIFYLFIQNLYSIEGISLFVWNFLYRGEKEVKYIGGYIDIYLATIGTFVDYLFSCDVSTIQKTKNLCCSTNCVPYFFYILCPCHKWNLTSYSNQQTLHSDDDRVKHCTTK